MIDCHDVMKRLWEYVDNELPPDEARAIADHLAMCARCSPQHRFQMTFLAAVVRAHAGRAGPRPGFAGRLRAALRAIDPTAVS